jgi:hypothetical protein
MAELVADRPSPTSLADVTVVTLGVTFTASIEASNDQKVVVRASGEGMAWLNTVEIGTPVELYWVDGYEERTLPARIAEVEEGLEPRWHLAPTGPAERSQRRKAVRARVAVPVVLPWAGSLLTGQTIDLSESGAKALLDGWGLPPDSGTQVTVTLSLERTTVDLRAQVVWHADRGAQWLIAVAFQDVSERDSDVLRARVFQALREERAGSN